MKVLTVFLFGVFIFILTCTKNVHELILYQQIYFQWNGQPEFNHFLDFTGYPFHSPTYLLQKIGHSMFFFLFSFFLSRLFFSLNAVFVIGVIYGLLTEFAQLFFSRTGCLLDVFYDSMGVLSYCTLAFISKVHYFHKDE
ncbi:VanZ family protein [Rossellomorea sp. NPDC077527]|uniref:VanZ family protein n=1 Tax=Rossellomorea sp. NPDC077527 TaxID=3364510 RepID=UPI0037C5BA4F